MQATCACGATADAPSFGAMNSALGWQFRNGALLCPECCRTNGKAKKVADNETIKARVQARRLAGTVLDIAVSEVHHLSEDARLAFWETIRDEALVRAPFGQVATEPKIVPMTEAQAVLFETVIVPYGKHLKRSVGEMMDVEPTWADWLVGQTDPFKDDLARYLASDRGKARLEGRAF